MGPQLVAKIVIFTFSMGASDHGGTEFQQGNQGSDAVAGGDGKPGAFPAEGARAVLRQGDHRRGHSAQAQNVQKWHQTADLPLPFAPFDSALEVITAFSSSFMRSRSSLRTYSLISGCCMAVSPAGNAA